MATGRRASEVMGQVAQGNPELIEEIVGAQIRNTEGSGLDPKTHAGVLVAVAPTAGMPRGRRRPRAGRGARQLPTAAQADRSPRR